MSKLANLVNAIIWVLESGQIDIRVGATPEQMYQMLRDSKLVTAISLRSVQDTMWFMVELVASGPRYVLVTINNKDVSLSTSRQDNQIIHFYLYENILTDLPTLTRQELINTYMTEYNEDTFAGSLTQAKISSEVDYLLSRQLLVVLVVVKDDLISLPSLANSRCLPVPNSSAKPVVTTNFC